MATPRKPKDQHLQTGRPSLYDPEYCERVVKHCSGGNSFESFGAVVGVCRETLYGWMNAHPEFLNARKRALESACKFYEDLGKIMATGQLRRVKSEKPILHEGKPVLDEEGQVMMEREYEPAQGNAAAWIFLTKNILGWRDKRDIVVAGDERGGPIRLRADDLTPQERMREIAEMTKALADLDAAEREAKDDGDKSRES